MDIQTIAGHSWSIAGLLRAPFTERGVPESRPWTLCVEDPALGTIRLSGRLRVVPGAARLLVVVHGLGGHPSAHYARRAAVAAERAGWSCLRFAMRGADGSGEDFYHAGLTTDLHALLESPEVTRHARVHVVGYSLGGHVALRLAAEADPRRLSSVAAVCPPTALPAAARACDEEMLAAYRLFILDRLKRQYGEIAARRALPAPVAEVRRVRTFREWDELVVVPRWGFADVTDYHESTSAAPGLERLRVPALVVAAEGDPIVPEGCIRAGLPPGGAPGLEVRWAPGGHVVFPPWLDLGLGGRSGLEPQLLAWFTASG